MEKLKEIKLLDNTILKVFRDDSAESPNDWGNEELFLVYDHRQFQVDRDGFKPRDVWDYLKAKRNEESEATEFDDYFIFTVYAYIHSGVSLSLSKGGDTFDTSSTGFILVKEDALTNEEYPDKTLGEIAEIHAQNLIDSWNTYLSGNVYGFEHYATEECPHCGNVTEDELLDSCYSIYTDKVSDILDELSKDCFDETHKSLLDA